MLSNLCSILFIQDFGRAVGGDCGQWIIDNATEIHLDCQLNYDVPEKNLIAGTGESYPEMLGKKYSISLNRIYGANIEEYNAIDNSQMTEEEYNSGEDVTTRHGGENKDFSGSDTATQNGTNDTSMTNMQATTAKTTYDSENYVPTDKKEGHGDTLVTVDMVNKVEYGKNENKTIDDESTLKHGHTVIRKRKGNIGVMPNQDLVAKEFELRLKYLMFNVIKVIFITNLASGVWESGDE